MCRTARFRVPWGTWKKVGVSAKSGWSWGYCCLMGSNDTTEDRTTALSSAKSIATAQAVLRLALA
ncbi:hypothetical protein HMPREF9696_00634 [Afipia clevelandensis ATCC 49720]|uniref:Uncharacterized protein n=1 Tax=Afipia clevelandensis ATCC 49720 TaxID=883079 RepID=K8PPA9_9BRAD|nr:hypothetical protein HMPREF9696_00634 [Afipia clevelandensis ATCC 49720]